MKKSLVLVLITALSSSAMAQKGSIYAGGLVGYGTSTEKDANDIKDVTTTWAFAPEVGTFLKDDIQVGIALGLGGSTSKYDGEKYESESGFNPTLYGRKFCTITDNLSGFAGLYLNFISNKVTDIDDGEEIEFKQSGFGANIGVGVAFALSPRFTAVGQYGLLGYRSVSNEVEGTDSGSESGFDIGVNTVGGSSFVQGNGSGAVFNIGIYYTIKPSPGTE